MRLHALRISNELFLRSQGFRTLLAPNISPFLALTVGHRSEAPLPGPADVATQLRQAALEALEIWDERFGSLYGQVTAKGWQAPRKVPTSRMPSALTYPAHSQLCLSN